MRLSLGLAVILSAVVAGTAGAQATATPALEMVDLRPAVIRGTGFVPHERVFVWLLSGRSWTGSALAAGTGSFTVRFRTSLPSCHRFTVQAFGSTGSRARLLSGLQRDCEPELPER